MRRLIVAVAIVFAVCSTGNAQVGLSVNINVNRPAQAPEGYVATCDDDDMFREDLFVINNTCVGFWVVLPTGGRVLHCRNMWYDRKTRDWYYGPWREDRTVTYVGYRHGPYYNVRFHDYMHRTYPRYYERRFRPVLNEREMRHEKFDNRDKNFEREKHVEHEQNFEREKHAEHEQNFEREKHVEQEKPAPGDYGREKNDGRDKNIEREKHDDQGKDNRGDHGHEHGDK
jgi:hypothetical protein